ncbi:hypothetical protein PVAP13_3NG274325 [Panicum virgatum]|uniref:Uncharacterized protein n=1 Tax=Panicum virgatum TaxID=38727 RepID=A0A8T0UIC0_PANVG|nr:hypothetical protein PVAP13_3NG274325 [Panicum virgatum]
MCRKERLSYPDPLLSSFLFAEREREGACGGKQSKAIELAEVVFICCGGSCVWKQQYAAGSERG